MAALARLMLAVALTLFAGTALAQTPLPSWNEGPSKNAIVEFVARVTRQGGPDFVQPAERIAVFDNDGTLWTEQPGPVQLAFALDRVKTLAPQHPEWKDKQPFKAALEGDMKALAEAGEHGILEMFMATPCKRSFLGEARPGAFLFGVPVDATAASVSAFCQACFSSLSDSDLEREALRVHRLVLPNARFEHDRPADPRSSRRSHNTG